MQTPPWDSPLWIAGRPFMSTERARVTLPFDGSAVADAAIAGPAELEQALAAGLGATAVMREMSRFERAEILRRARAGLLESAGNMADLITRESGKPLREARVEVQRGAMTLLFASEEASRLHGEEVPIDAAPGGAGRRGLMVREPVGVVAAITPFNFPLNLALHKIAPALAAGNSVVHKMASATPLSGILMARIFAAAGLPPGALNVLAGSGGVIGDALVADSRVRLVTFTGSVPVGAHIRERAGLKRVTLELGSNSGVIVAEDADLELAVTQCVPGSFSNSGQVCISVQRIFVQQKRHREFVERFEAKTAALRVGNPLDEATEVSSLISEAEARRVEQWIGEARQSGARLERGGERHAATLQPAVLTGVPPDARLMRDEAFGPVVSINAFEQLDQAVGMLNDSAFGLQAGLYTRDLESAFRIARQAQVGGIHVNQTPQFRVDQMPYGGVKQSGLGREGPRYAMEEMTEAKLITW